jgi:hypothetical protein
MQNNGIKKKSKVAPQVAIIVILALAVGASGLALLLSRSEPTAEALVVPRAIRVERVEGDVGVARALDGTSELEWAEATHNAPLSVGDRIYAKDGARAMLAFTGRNFARLEPETSLDVLSLSDRRTQLALRDGSAIFDLADLEPGELFEVATPNGAVDFYEPGLYQLGIDDGGNTMISVLSGLAQVVGLAGSGEISKGEILTLAAAAVAPLVLSKLAPELAGGIVDDYYGYRYDDLYDGRYRDYNAYLEDPFYYDPYRRSVSYQYVPSYNVPGIYDLDYYGDWVDVDGYGHCWSPRVSAGWAPYQNGYWDHDNVWGPTWVSHENWGWAPYHYGRWAHAHNSRWVWVPDRSAARPVYAPALVAFVPLTQTNQVAWVPLAPGEQYVPRYYDSNFQPQYLASPDVVSHVINVQRSFANINIPQAVAVVPVNEFYQEVDYYRLNHASPQLIAQAQPVLDPFAIESLRREAKQARRARRMIDVPPALQQQVLSTPVLASAAPIVPPHYRGALGALQVSPLSDKQKKRKMKLDENGQIVSARGRDGLPQPLVAQPNAPAVTEERRRRIAALATQAAQGDRAARREMKQLKKQERIDSRAIRGQAQPASGVVVAPQLSGDRDARKLRKEQKRLERQQRATGVVQQRSAEVFRQGERNRQIRQRATAQAQQQSVQREQRKAQKRVERQQRQTQQRQAPQQNYQQKQMVVIQQADKQRRQQRKAERRAARQQSAQQAAPQYQRPQVYQRPTYQQPAASAQANQNRQQRKAERRAARQQVAAPQYQSPQVQQRQAQQRQVQQRPAAAVQSSPDRQQRKAAKMERKAGRGKP